MAEACEFRNNVMIGAVAPDGWIMPSSTPSQLAGWQFINCNGQPSVINTGTVGDPNVRMVFADLPGQTSVFQPGPVDGMEYSITDSSLAASGHFAGAPSGGSTNHVKVRYTAAAVNSWLISG